jgi:outer membrane cobalamin receptor
VPLNDGFGGWIAWGMVPNTTERIEVIPGGSSNLSDTWAMGGVVRLVTEKPGAGTGVRAEGRVGNPEHGQLFACLRTGTDRLGLYRGARWFHTNVGITVPGSGARPDGPHRRGEALFASAGP